MGNMGGMEPGGMMKREGLAALDNSQDGEAVRLYKTRGLKVSFGAPFGLLGLNATASAWVGFENVLIPDEQVLCADFLNFIRDVRRPSSCCRPRNASAWPRPLSPPPEGD